MVFEVSRGGRGIFRVSDWSGEDRSVESGDGGMLLRGGWFRLQVCVWT